MGLKFFKKRKKNTKETKKHSNLQGQIDAINRGEYWDSGGKKNPELNQSDSISVRQKRVQELIDYHKKLDAKKNKSKTK